MQNTVVVRGIVEIYNIYHCLRRSRINSQNIFSSRKPISGNSPNLSDSIPYLIHCAIIGSSNVFRFSPRPSMLASNSFGCPSTSYRNIKMKNIGVKQKKCWRRTKKCGVKQKNVGVKQKNYDVKQKKCGV